MDTSAVHIRAASPDDVAGLVALEEASFTSDRYDAGDFRYFLARKRCAVLVAVERGAVQGCAIVEWRGVHPEGRLVSIAVFMQQRGRGIGPTLLRAAEEAVRRQGAARMCLEVRESNVKALGMYARAGYHETGRTPGYYSDGEAAVLMEKPLVPEPAG